jgi:hypothetical protein
VGKTRGCLVAGRAWVAHRRHGSFAFFPARDEQLTRLSELAAQEDWQYHNTHSEYQLPILFNYIRYTYRRIAEENKIALSENEQQCCFNTGSSRPPTRGVNKILTPATANA